MRVDIKKIDRYRLELGYSIKKLGKKAEMSTATISRTLTEVTKPRPDTIEKIAKALKKPVMDLYMDE